MSFLFQIQNEIWKSLFVSTFQQTAYLINEILVTGWILRFQNGCNKVVIELHVFKFGLKSCLRFRIELTLHAHLILKSHIWFQTKLHSTLVNYWNKYIFYMYFTWMRQCSHVNIMAKYLVHSFTWAVYTNDMWQLGIAVAHKLYHRSVDPASSFAIVWLPWQRNFASLYFLLSRLQLIKRWIVLSTR